MKTNFEMDNRVKSIVKRAAKQYQEYTGMKNRALTVDFLLYKLLDDSKSKLIKFMFQEGCFRDSFSDKNEYDEVNYTDFIEKLDDFYKQIRTLEEEKINSFYKEKNCENIYSIELTEVLEEAKELADRKKLEKIDEYALTIALINYRYSPIWKVLQEITMNDSYRDLVDYFSEERYLAEKMNEFEETNSTEISKEVVTQKSIGKKDKAEEMFKCMNEHFNKNGPQIIRGRETEIEKVFTILQKMTTRNVVLTGEPGVGKTAIAEGIAERIVKGTCPKEFIGKKVMSLDLNSVMENTSYVGQFQEKMKKLTQYLENHEEVIMFIDEFHNIIGAGRSKDSSYDFSNAIKPMLASGKVQVIAATTEEEYKKWICHDGALKRRFEKVEVKEPQIDKLYEMLLGKIEQLSKYHNVTVTEEIFKEVVSQAQGFYYDKKNPSKTVDLLDTAMVFAKNKNKKTLDILSILEVNKEKFKTFNKMKELDEEEVLRTAYHEAGHYIFHKHYCEKFEKVTLISIIPADDYMGINCLEKNGIFVRSKRHELVEQIAEMLSGDIATKLKCKEGDAGKSSDLEVATNICRKMVLQYGMQVNRTENSSLGKYNSFANTGKVVFENLSNEQKNELSAQTDKLLKEATELAREFIKNHEVQLDIIAKGLMQKGTLTGTQAENLYDGKLTLEDLPKSGVELIK